MRYAGPRQRVTLINAHAAAHLAFGRTEWAHVCTRSREGTRQAASADILIREDHAVTRHTALLRSTLAALTLAALAAPASAQNEAALKSHFEGRRITLRIDMPGAASGVNIRPEPGEAFDPKDYRNDLKRYGTAIYAGDTAVVTEVKVKKDLIEFQIGGGGFGTIGDDTNTSSGIQMLEKSEREKRLEREVKNETARDRKRALQRDLDDLRDRRERENRRLRAESERIEEAKRQRIADQRLRSGSRFNLRYKDRVPPGITPDAVTAALTEYVDFRNSSAADARSAPPPPDVSQLRKGMLRSDVERALGTPAQKSDKREGGTVTTTLVFEVGEQTVTAAFVEDVLVRYTISSK